jgi:hypothetical protein
LRTQSLLFGGSGLIIDHVPVASPGFRIRPVVKPAVGSASTVVVETNPRPAFVDWRANLRCWDMAPYLDHGGSLVDHHLNGIHDDYFDEETVRCNDQVNVDAKEYSTPFQDILDLVRQSEATGYLFDGRERQDTDKAGGMVLIGFWR